MQLEVNKRNEKDDLKQNLLQKQSIFHGANPSLGIDMTPDTSVPLALATPQFNGNSKDWKRIAASGGIAVLHRFFYAEIRGTGCLPKKCNMCKFCWEM